MREYHICTMDEDGEHLLATRQSQNMLTAIKLLTQEFLLDRVYYASKYGRYGMESAVYVVGWGYGRDGVEGIVTYCIQRLVENGKKSTAYVKQLVLNAIETTGIDEQNEDPNLLWRKTGLPLSEYVKILDCLEENGRIFYEEDAVCLNE
ncbi:hypothetical protein DFP93_101217 [Aneurinibacillus soli]|uniref:Uncharacterized protein n=1 Tax=Aneurinibacillus soli TaxID=1500254 RepID=A0A0U5BBQ3_9BACL|nr:hypothetical protein [Aneurinibacillus soli]PYE64192.1 hypothetical protein DFP93_101217 [Aneurinibacillus soli]BAU28141.1 hypothetical protein CB4_02315 [Aneurinibacillus soli]